jgi:hypothetical protein
VLNIVTKSGTNRYTGSIFGYARPEQLEGDFTQFQSINGTVQTINTQQSDAGASGGGPIIPDRLATAALSASRPSTPADCAPSATAGSHANSTVCAHLGIPAGHRFVVPRLCLMPDFHKRLRPLWSRRWLQEGGSDRRSIMD